MPVATGHLAATQSSGLVRHRTLLQREEMTTLLGAVLLAALRDMWFSGLVTGDRVNGYQLVTALRRGRNAPS